MPYRSNDGFTPGLPMLPPTGVDPLGSSLRPPAVRSTAEPGLERLVRVAAAALAVPTTLFSVVEEGRELVRAAVVRGRRAPLREIPLEHSLCARVVAGGNPVRIPDVRELAECDGNPLIDVLGVVGYLAAPVIVDTEVVGVLSAISDTRRPWSPEDVALMVDLAALTAGEIELGRLRHARLERPQPPVERVVPTPAPSQATLLDRRGFQAAAQERMVAARRDGRGLLLYLVRVDDVARIRDRFGPEVADAALADVVAVTARSARPGDLVGRLTSDAFVLLADDSGQGDAARVLGRIQLGIAELNAGAERTWTLSARCGVAGWDPARPTPVDQLLLRADASARERARGQVSA